MNEHVRNSSILVLLGYAGADVTAVKSLWIK